MDAILAENQTPTVPEITQEQIMRLYNERLNEKASDPAQPPAPRGWLQRVWEGADVASKPSSGYGLPDRVIRDPVPGTEYPEVEQLSRGSPGKWNNPERAGITDIKPDTSTRLPMYQPAPREIPIEVYKKRHRRT